ncbi:MAG: hypothetical protein VB934_06890 [Polyangiaceae bacterium]
MRGLRRIWVLCVVAFLAGLSGSASAKLVNKKMKAKKGTPLYAVTESLKLIAADKHDEWMEKWCDKKTACSGRATRARVMLDIAKKKITKGCVKKNKVYVVQITEKMNGKWMILTKCGDKRTVTFSLQKRDGKWKVRGLS